MTDFNQGDHVMVSDDGEDGNYSGLGVVTTMTDVAGYVFVRPDTPQADPGDWVGEFPFHVRRVRLVERAASSGQVMPVDSAARKDVPVTSGVFDYFPAALAEIARVSKAGNDKHNPGEPLHWARGKSMDQADAIGRHLIDRGGTDPDTGMRHSAELAWRALAMLQLELEEAGAPLARGASA